jgi:hypothetical protein
VIKTGLLPEDVPRVAITWQQMIKQEIIMLKERVTLIEDYLREAGIGKDETGEKTPSEVGVGEEGEGGTEGASVTSLTSVLVLTMQARRALFGYGKLLEEMGLSKDQKKTVKDLEYIGTIVLRLMQTIRLLQAATVALEAGSIYGLPLAVIGGGTFAASLAYGMKLGGN